MLSRPSFSIRKLIPQRKSDVLDDADSYHDAEGKSKSWPRGSRKGPIPSIEIRRSEDLHRIGVLPPLPDTPKSWTSSVYSDDGEAFTRPRSSPTPEGCRTPQRSPLLAPQQLDVHQRPRSSSLAPLTPPLLPYSPPSSPRSRPPKDGSPVSPLDPVDTPFAHTGPGSDSLYPGDIEQLIRETDEAFRLWHSSIERVPPSPPTSASDMSDDATQDTGRSPVSRRTSQRSARSSASSITSTTKAPLKIGISSGQTSFPGTKKPKLKKAPIQRPSGSASWPISSSPPSRWTLTESAKDLFAIRIFSRIEADEMLPESVLHEIRMSRATQARLAREAAAAGRGLDDESEPDVLFFSEDLHSLNTHRKELVQTQPDHVESPIDSAMVYNFDEPTAPVKMVVGDQPRSSPTNGLPVPPAVRKHHRRRSPMKQTAPLPTIPEVVAVGTEPGVLSPTSRRKATAEQTRVNTDDYIFLPSTPFSFYSRGFRHGPIRLAKADLPYIEKLAAAVDDTLDWTAFQMAIIGGAGDFFGESTDYSKPSDSELAERDDMASWFAEFGFDGPGGLVSAADDVEAMRRQSTPTPPESPVRTPPAPVPSVMRPPSTVAELETKEVPLSLPLSPPPRYSAIVGPTNPPEYFLSTGIGLGQEGVAAYYRNRPRSGAPFPGTTSGGTYIDPSPGGYPLRRESTESVQSLPQSPMLDLVVSRDVDGNEYVVPMGFNLGHDLGDFLRWEADNVFGGGYYGPDTV